MAAAAEAAPQPAAVRLPPAAAAAAAAAVVVVGVSALELASEQEPPSERDFQKRAPKRRAC